MTTSQHIEKKCEEDVFSRKTVKRHRTPKDQIKRPSMATKWSDPAHLERMRQAHLGKTSTHNLSGTRLYMVWVAMKARCQNKNNHAYKDYGGRGILCEWPDFAAFAKDMKESYLDHLSKYETTTIDRIDNDGNYSKANCRWATRKEQILNTRRTVYITIEGVTKSISEWCDLKGISRSTVYNRIKKYSEDPVDAITRPVRSDVHGKVARAEWEKDKAARSQENKEV